MNISPIQCQPNLSITNPLTKLVRGLLPMLLILSLVSQVRAQDDMIDVWIGTGKIGIYHLTLDTNSGKLSEPTMESPTAGAGFLAMHPNGKVLYSTDRSGGSVAAFDINQPVVDKELLKLKAELVELKNRFGPKHPKIRAHEEQIRKRKKEASEAGVRLTLLNRLETGDGGSACVAIDQSGRVLLSAQYGGGSTSSYSVNPDGSLKERVEKIEHGEGTKVNPRRQEAAHPHWVGTSPDNRFVFVPDLGADRVFVYELDAEQASLKLHSKIPVPPGSGPRHMKFHTTGKYVYVLNELALTISVFEYDAEKAEFKDIQLIKTLSEEAKAKEKQNTAAEIRVHPSGKFVYSSNRGHDSISVFSVDQATGKLTLVEQVHVRGAWPRNFNLDPSGKWLIAAGQNSNTLSLFEVDQESGKLTYTQKTVNVPAPICVLFENE